MAGSFRRTALHSTIILCVLVLASALLPAAASAACYNGRCPTGEDDDSDQRVSLNITLSVSPEGSGRIEVNGEELEDDVYVTLQGDVVELEAVAERGYEFAGWTGSFTSSENPWETPFYNHKTLTANFVLEKERLSTHEVRGLSVDIPEETEALNADGSELDDVSIKVVKAHDVPEGMMVVSRVYDVAPDGATFDPPITLAIEYEQGDVPEGVDDELTLAWFDGDVGAWTPLDSDVDESDGIIRAEVAHFSEFCVLAPAPEGAAAVAPASGSGPAPLTSPGFSLSNLEISPCSANAGESVSISVQAQYSGSETQGVSRIVLSIDGAVVDEQEVTLGAGEGGRVGFSYTPSTDGAHEVNVNGLQGILSVTPAAPVALSQAVALAQEDDSFHLELPGLPSFSWLRGWGTIGCVAAGAVLLLLLLSLPLLRRRILRYRYDI